LQEYIDLWYTQRCYGVRKQAISCQSINTKLFQVLKDAANVEGVFVGNDHVNNFHGTYQGVELYYGNATGWASEENSDRNHFTRGARVITLNKNSLDILSYLVSENGRINQKRHNPGSINNFIMYKIEKNTAIKVISSGLLSLLMFPFSSIYWGIKYTKYKKLLN
jgi:hypothetical protein